MDQLEALAERAPMTTWDYKKRQVALDLLKEYGFEAYAEELDWRSRLEHAIEIFHGRWIRAIDPRRVRPGDLFISVGSNLFAMPDPHYRVDLNGAEEDADVPRIQEHPGRYLVFRPRRARSFIQDGQKITHYRVLLKQFGASYREPWDTLPFLAEFPKALQEAGHDITWSNVDATILDRLPPCLARGCTVVILRREIH